MKTIFSITSLFFLFTFLQLTNSNTFSSSQTEVRKTIKMVTNYGDIVLELYNETPLHRDNFIKLVNEGSYDSLLFHRVIPKFMIQGGDPESKLAQTGDTLGEGDKDYMVDAEFNPNLFHKKGVLAAARDGNLDRASSAMQFYIVQGKIFNDSLLDKAENRINVWLAEHYFKKDPVNKAIMDALNEANQTEEYEEVSKLQDSKENMAKAYKNFTPYIIPDAHREIYKSIGGTPHLDQNYTVFGEVIEGMDVVDAIAAVKTDSLDRPVDDVRIIKMKIIK